MKIWYLIGSTDEVSRPLASHSLVVAKELEEAVGPEALPSSTIYGLIRIISDGRGFGKYVDVDKVFSDLKSSGFLTEETLTERIQ